MKQLIILVLSLIIFTSCRKDFASFQKSTNSNYSYSKSNSKTNLSLTPSEPILTASIENFAVFSYKTTTFSSKTIEFKERNTSLADGRKRRNRKKVSKKEGTFIQKIFPNQTHNDKKVVKKRRNPVPFNSTIYTGFIILGIAILLALVSLSSLSLLFGVAAIVFLYLGFKKYFRKKRRRDIFR